MSGALESGVMSGALESGVMSGALESGGDVPDMTDVDSPPPPGHEWRGLTYIWEKSICETRTKTGSDK